MADDFEYEYHVLVRMREWYHKDYLGYSFPSYKKDQPPPFVGWGEWSDWHLNVSNAHDARKPYPTLSGARKVANQHKGIARWSTDHNKIEFESKLVRRPVRTEWQEFE